MERNKFLVFCFGICPRGRTNVSGDDEKRACHHGCFLGGERHSGYAQFRSSLRIFAHHLVLCFL